MTTLALLALYGVACVAITLGWQEFLKHRARMATLREECERLGHRWGDPFEGMGSLHRNCLRCKFQQHYHSETQTWK